MKRLLCFFLLLVLGFSMVAGAASAPFTPSTARPRPPAAPPVEPSAPQPPVEPSAPPASEPTPVPTPEPTPAPTPVPGVVAHELYPSIAMEDYTYYLKVNYQANTVTVYTRGDGEYFDEPCLAMVCSTGPSTPRSGIYRLGWRLEWQDLFYDVYGRYATEITGDILFHSVPYQVKYDDGSLEYWEFDKLGTSASAGCVRLQLKDAKWIYDHLDEIYAVEFYGDTDPGPLGKPTVPQISDDELRCGWDPTDTSPDSPWFMTDEEIYAAYPWLRPEPAAEEAGEEDAAVVLPEDAPEEAAPPEEETPETPPDDGEPVNVG